MSRTRPPRRNQPCGCGSGRKYKHCCESTARRHGSRFWLFAVAGIIAVAILVTLATVPRGDRPARVWSAEHGHWHDAQ